MLHARAMLAPLPAPTASLAVCACHVTASCAAYCCRRGVLHSLGAREVARRHITFEPEWPQGLRGIVGFTVSVVSFLLLFLPVYPLLEPALRTRGLASFFYYYPSANGCGVLVERVSDRVQLLRLDWHRFRVNVGAPGRPYEHGGCSRHPPAVELNVPHIDWPCIGVRHWPWRQHTGLMMPVATRRAVWRAKTTTRRRTRSTSPQDH